MRTSPMVEEVARDREGRLRSEHYVRSSPAKPSGTQTLTMSDGSTRTVNQDEVSHVIMISDCSAGTTIQIQPGMRIARIFQGPKREAPPDPNRQYSSPYFPSRSSKPNPRIQFEDLGFREIQGVPVHGGRSTTLGAEEDREWNGKPIRSDEQWISDDFAIFLLIVRKDFKTGAESRMELINVKFVDPDPGLFQIPEGYMVNPAIGNLPKVYLGGSPVSTPH